MMKRETPKAGSPAVNTVGKAAENKAENTASDGRRLLVTGGSRGIGAATVRLAARQGYRVLFSYHHRAVEAGALVEELRQEGAEVHAWQADVAVESDVLALFAEADRHWGGLDALVNNAGVVAMKSRLDEMSVERLQALFAINVTGAFLCAREAVKRLSPRHGGRGGALVNVTSRAARIGSPGMYIDYAASKAAVETMTLGLAKEVAGEGIRVNGVAPGIIRTEIHGDSGDPGRADKVGDSIPLGRAGEPEEVARAILWLLSDEASYVTGTLVDVAGGR